MLFDQDHVPSVFGPVNMAAEILEYLCILQEGQRNRETVLGESPCVVTGNMPGVCAVSVTVGGIIALIL